MSPKEVCIENAKVWEKEYLAKNFNAKIEVERLVDWIRKWFKKNGNGCNAVIGISGGKDSTVNAALLVKALGRDRVIGVLMPNGEQKDISDSEKVVKILQIKNYKVNIGASFDAIISEVTCAGVNPSNQTKINLAPRIRMAALYAVSQSNNGRVVNTCNLSEDWVGYSTRYGDSVGDFSPLSRYTVGEVKAIGKELVIELEEELGKENAKSLIKLIDKTPSDGLTQLTDEDNLGFMYVVLDRYIRTGKIEDEEAKAIIDKKRIANKFKLELMPCFENGIHIALN